MNKKITAITAALMLSALGLAGCSAPDTEPAPSTATAPVISELESKVVETLEIVNSDFNGDHEVKVISGKSARVAVAQAAGLTVDADPAHCADPLSGLAGAKETASAYIQDGKFDHKELLMVSVFETDAEGEAVMENFRNYADECELTTGVIDGAEVRTQIWHKSKTDTVDGVSMEAEIVAASELQGTASILHIRNGNHVFSYGTQSGNLSDEGVHTPNAQDRNGLIRTLRLMLDESPSTSSDESGDLGDN